MFNYFVCFVRRSGGFGFLTFVMEIGVRCGTFTTRIGCCFLNDFVLYVKSCVLLLFEINILFLLFVFVVSMVSVCMLCVCGCLFVVYVYWLYFFFLFKCLLSFLNFVICEFIFEVNILFLFGVVVSVSMLVLCCWYCINLVENFSF